MPRPRTDEYWEDMVKGIVANKPKVSVAEIERRLDKHAKTDECPAERRADVPRGNTIRRMRERFPEEDHGPYRFVQWPETFERGDLPWESAPFVIELMREVCKMFGRTEPPPMGPPVKLAYWYWRIRTSCPDLPVAFSAAVQMYHNAESAAPKVVASMLFGHDPELGFGSDDGDPSTWHWLAAMLPMELRAEVTKYAPKS